MIEAPDRGCVHLEVFILDVYQVALDTLRVVRPLVARVAQADADLARQLRRALASVCLNLAEGAGSQGRNRRARYYTALGSARESLACREVAEALGYLPELSPDVSARMNRVIGTLVRLVR